MSAAITDMSISEKFARSDALRNIFGKLQLAVHGSKERDTNNNSAKNDLRTLEILSSSGSSSSLNGFGSVNGNRNGRSLEIQNSNSVYQG